MNRNNRLGRVYDLYDVDDGDDDDNDDDIDIYIEGTLTQTRNDLFSLPAAASCRRFRTIQATVKTIVMIRRSIIITIILDFSK